MNPKELSEAINQDVTDTTEQPTLTSPESPRAKALAAIEESHRARMEDEMGVKFSDEPADDVQEDPQVTQQLDDQEQQEPGQSKFKVKVDGVELEVSAEDLIRTYQKNSAADRRLEEAARILREAEELAAQKQVVEQEVAQGENKNLRDEAANVLSKVYEGDQEAAAEALVSLLSKTKGGDQPTTRHEIDEEALTNQVLERMAFNTAVERVKSDYPDIVADKNLEQLVVMQSNNLVSAGMARADALLSVADNLYKSLGKMPAGRQHDTSRQTSVRQANKERLDPVPSASATASLKPVQNEAMDQSALIREAAKRRVGGQSLSY